MSAQNTPQVRTLDEYGRIVRRRWPWIAVILPTVLVSAILYAYLWPPLYRASGTLMLEPSALPQAMVPTIGGRALSDELEAREQLELLRRRVMSDEALQGIAQRVDPAPRDRSLTLAERAARIKQGTSLEAVDPVTMEPAKHSSAFSVHYDDRDPQVAKAIVDELLQLFVTYNQRMRADRANEAYRFLADRSKEIEAEMATMEVQLATFKARYGDALPDAMDRNQIGVDRVQRDLDVVTQQIVAAQERESLLAVQLESVSPSLATRTGDWRAELSKLRGELAIAEQKYTAEHPDVRRLRRAVAEMAAQGFASDAAVATAADNPEYLRARSQLDGVRRELGTLRVREGRLRGELAGYLRNVATAPTVERDYVRLARAYESAQRRYQDVQDKLKAASLSQGLEEEARGERFTLIREAYTPRQPHSPNRAGVILLGLVLGVLLAVLAAVVVDSGDPTVRGTDDLEATFGRMPMGVVPPIPNPGDLRRKRLYLGSMAGAYGLAVAGIVAAVTIAA